MNNLYIYIYKKLPVCCQQFSYVKKTLAFKKTLTWVHIDKKYIYNIFY